MKMGLRLIMGPSGSGKSTKLYQEIIDRSLEERQRNFLVIVPDQFTMQTQKDLCLMHPKKGIMNIDVLSFGRLAHRIFEEVGGKQSPVLDDTGKNLVLRNVARQEQDKLQIFQKNLNKIGYIHEVKSAISEFMQYDISLEKLQKLIEFSKEKGSLSYKLKDLEVLYEGFLSYNKDKFITTEETLTLLKKELRKSRIIKDSIIAFDGFTGFTPVQNEVIKELLLLAKEVIVTVTMDAENPYELLKEQDMFYLSSKTIHTLEMLEAEVSGEKVRSRRRDTVLGERPVFRYRDNRELAHLEKNLFRLSKESYSETCEHIFLSEAKSFTEEVRYVGVQIKRLLREENYKYQDIAVVTGDLQTYAHFVEKEFPKFGIPFFLDMTKGILLNPFIEYIKSGLEIVLGGYSYETIFHFLRSGMVDISTEEIDALENYVLALGIKGVRRWNSLWTRKGPDMGDDFTEELASLNESREKITELLRPFHVRKATVSDFTQNLYVFIVSSHLQEKLANYEAGFQAEGDLARAREYAQIYRLVMELLDQMMELLKEETMTLKEYTEILYAGFDEIQVGLIPQNVDQVVVGDIERTRLKKVKALFFIGVNDGMIPKSGGTGGIISDVEREYLAGSEYELAPTPRQKMFVQRLYLYMNMTKPTEYLYLSYAKVDAMGNAMRPAYLIGMIRKLFEQLSVRKVNFADIKEVLATKEDGFDYFVTALREYAQGNGKPDVVSTLLSWYQADPLYRDKLAGIFKASFYHYENHPLSKAVASTLYGKVLENSVSRLEQYAACAYSHFLKYGLQLTEREEFSFERLDMGNVFHGVLERFAEKLEASPYTWFDFPKEAGEQFLTEALEGYTADYGETVLFSSARNEYLITRMKRILLRTIDTLQYQLKKGVFQPSQFEVSFSVLQDLESVNIALSKDEHMRLRGRIDRVDTCEDENHVYVKVIDYKSGNKSFDLVALYYGLQLQLVVYLNAAMNLEQKKHPNKKIVPAAVLYYHMEDPCIATEGKQMSEEEINQSIREKLRMKGLVNGDKEVVGKLDATLNGKSDVIPIEYKKDGSFTAASSVMGEESLGNIAQFVTKKITDIGREIVNGSLEVNPYEMNGKAACTYCAYQSVCGFDTRIAGFQTRKLEAISKEEAYERIVKEKDS